MKVDGQNYDRMRAWLACVAPQVFPADLMTPETDPITVLDRMAAVSPANARRGLSMAVNDIVELTSAWPAAQIAAIDNGLLAAELPSLSEVRARFSKALQRVLRRGRIKDEVEYHAVRNAAELFGEDQERFWPLLAMYKEAATG